jgi:hypothetical protein
LSEGNLEKKYRESYNANTTISRGTKESFRNTMNDPGGFRRGEATAVRPNMEESMKFFKKLFTQPQDGGAAGFSTALSPPDSPRRCKFDLSDHESIEDSLFSSHIVSQYSALAICPRTTATTRQGPCSGRKRLRQYWAEIVVKL